MSPALALSIPAPAERHDEWIRTRLAPVLRAFHGADPALLVWFQRANKPDWGLRLLATGDADRLDHEVRPAFAAAFDVAGGEAHFVEEPGHDKWTGGLDLATSLGPFLPADTHAALDALDAEARGELGSRARFDLAVIEGLLDAFALTGERRLAWYRESFEWAIDLGRWDREVLDSLERAFESHRTTLESVTGARDGRWPTAAAARIGEGMLDALGDWPRSRGAVDSGVVLHAARGHSNRLGIHGGREASLRYLVWRARGGRALEPA